MDEHARDVFPPSLTVENRVWTEHGFKEHGPVGGPKVDIPGRMGGTIIETQQPYMTMYHSLYTVRWDNGQVSKHYRDELFCIGRHQTLAEFETAIDPKGAVELTVGPAGGFRRARLQLEFDGMLQSAEISDRRLWLECIEPLVRQRKLNIKTVKLKRGE